MSQTEQTAWVTALGGGNHSSWEYVLGVYLSVKRQGAQTARSLIPRARIPEEPQSQQPSLPGSRCTSSMMAFVRSSRLLSPVLCSPRKAMVSASSLLFVSTEIHLPSETGGRRRKRLAGHCILLPLQENLAFSSRTCKR